MRCIIIFFNKKRIIAISFLLLAVTLICLLNPFIEPESKETVALPVSNKVVVIDAGHGNPDVGVILLGKQEIRII